MSDVDVLLHFCVLADCTRVAGNFWEVFTQIGEHAASYRTSTRYIGEFTVQRLDHAYWADRNLSFALPGDAMLEVAEVHRQIELQRGDVVGTGLSALILLLLYFFLLQFNCCNFIVC